MLSTGLDRCRADELMLHKPSRWISIEKKKQSICSVFCITRKQGVDCDLNLKPQVTQQLFKQAHAPLVVLTELIHDVGIEVHIDVSNLNHATSTVRADKAVFS